MFSFQETPVEKTDNEITDNKETEETKKEEKEKKKRSNIFKKPKKEKKEEDVVEDNKVLVAEFRSILSLITSTVWYNISMFRSNLIYCLLLLYFMEDSSMVYLTYTRESSLLKIQINVEILTRKPRP